MNIMMISGLGLALLGLFLVAVNWRSELPRRLFWTGLGIAILGAAGRLLVQVVR